MSGIEIIVGLFLLYFVIRNAVQDGINRSVLGKSKKEDNGDDII